MSADLEAPRPSRNETLLRESIQHINSEVFRINSLLDIMELDRAAAPIVSERLFGVERISKAIRLLISEARNTIDSLLQEIPGANEYSAALQHIALAGDRGITTRTIFPTNAPTGQGQPLVLEGVRELSNAPVMSRFMIFDSDTLLVETGEIAGSTITASIIHNPRIVTCFAVLFNFLWNQAGETGGAQEPDAVTITPRESLILSGLIAGETDRKIAANNGISERTVQRVIAELRDRFDANSRPALIAKVISLGNGPKVNSAENSGAFQQF